MVAVILDGTIIAGTVVLLRRTELVAVDVEAAVDRRLIVELFGG
jgi:hypothetical protein